MVVSDEVVVARDDSYSEELWPMYTFPSAVRPCQPPYILLSISAAVPNVPKPLHTKGRLQVTLVVRKRSLSLRRDGRR